MRALRGGEFFGYKQIERAAFHEAGHAVMAHRFRRPLRVVEISEHGAGNTLCLELRADAKHKFSLERYRELVIEEIHVWSAGWVAEELFAGTFDPSAARVDIERVQFWLTELGIGSGRSLGPPHETDAYGTPNVGSGRSGGHRPSSEPIYERQGS